MYWTLWRQAEHSMTLNAPQIVTSEMNITCLWGMQMPHAGSPLMRNHAPLADVNSERSMLGFSAEACLATFWFSNGFAAGFSLNLEEVWDPCAMQGQRHSEISYHSQVVWQDPLLYLVCKDRVQGQRHTILMKPYKMKEWCACNLMKGTCISTLCKKVHQKRRKYYPSYIRKKWPTTTNQGN